MAPPVQPGAREGSSLTGRTALVTGGGRGIGRAIAIALARAGADVAVAARTRSEIEAVAGEVERLGRKAFAFALDLAERLALGTAHVEVARALGPIDILVNNGGITAGAPLERTEDAQWDAILAVNLTAPFLLTRACLPSMYARKFGRVINVASVAGKTGLKYSGAYTASKHGLIGLTRTLALEGAKKGVTANAVCPGWTDTRMMDDAVREVSRTTGRTAEEARSALLRVNPIGRPASPEEVAAVAVMLAENGAVNGQAIQVDGGELIA